MSSIKFGNSRRDVWMKELLSRANGLNEYYFGMLLKTAWDLIAEQPAKKNAQIIPFVARANQ